MSYPPLNPHQFEPPPGDIPSCGNRKDLPKAQRRHPYLDAGTDMRHTFSGDYKVLRILICPRCGREDARSIK